jgi:DNA (cytosine-5)-methyltransferase 1
MSKTMQQNNVIDIFCGAGGFSEGFRQAGFKIEFGLDNWTPAIKTFEFNHPAAQCALTSVLDFSEDNIDLIPNSDIIIGSPPCTAFSKSNRGGNGDIDAGMALVLKLFQIVALKKPKFWMLENVPPLEKHLKRKYTYHELNLTGGSKTALEIPNMLAFNAADFGVPQNRYRLLCGNFPIPQLSYAGNHVTLRKILEALPSPTLKQHIAGYIADPNYNFKIATKYLSDHFYDTSLARFQWQEAARLKVDHSYYGKMSFPENLSKPSRTVMATLSRVSREAMIFGVGRENHYTSYRVPTVREVACIQSYPINYQFIADREETKYQLVGNSVPPLMSYAFACAIARKMGLAPKRNPNENGRTLMQPSVNLNGMKRGKILPKKRPFVAKFRMHVPFLKVKNFRVDLDNLSSSFKSQKFVWSSSIHHGTGREHAKKAMPELKNVAKLIEKSAYSDEFAYFGKELRSRLDGRIPDSTEFQRLYCRMSSPKRYLGPEETLSEIRKLVDRHFPMQKYGDAMLINNGEIGMDETKIPLQIAAALYACGYVEQRTRK